MTDAPRLLADDVDTVLLGLKESLADRAVVEDQAESTRQAEFDAAARDRLRAGKHADTAHAEAIAALETQRDEKLRASRTEADANLTETSARRKREQREIESKLRAEEESLHAKYKEALWTADSVFEGAQQSADEGLNDAQRKSTHLTARSEGLRPRIEPLLDLAGLEMDPVEPAKQDLPVSEALNRMAETVTDLEAATHRLESLPQRKWLTMGRLAVIALVVSLVLVGLSLAVGLKLWMAGMAAAAGAVISMGLTFYLVERSLNRAVEVLANRLETGFGRLRILSERGMYRAAVEHTEAIRRADSRRTFDRGEADGKFPKEIMKLQVRRKELLDHHEARFFGEAKAIEDKAAATAHEINSGYESQRERVEAGHRRKLEEADAMQERRRELAQKNWQGVTDELAARWSESQSRIGDAWTRLQDATAERFLPFDDDVWRSPPSPAATPQGMRFGTIPIDPAKLPQGSRPNSPLTPAIAEPIELPAFLPFPQKGSLMIRTPAGQRDRGARWLTALMLRFLTAMPAGKVRFTVIDPVGLGEAFASFMHLADSDELLISSRIWTEAAAIEKQLQLVTSHMETVIQKYLRHQYKSIEEYNQLAGEVAEPYRVVVVNGFPTHFSPDAARRLVSIVESGAPCGVFALVTYDPANAPPQGVSVKDLEANAVIAEIDGSRLRPKMPSLAGYEFIPDSAPDSNRVADMVREIGKRGREANRVEVPFAFVAPSEDKYWTFSAANGVSVPIGRAGATKRRAIELGEGTSQHVLIAGKTGSGKSTLLHALILNSALSYRPEELELYLIDFKKGVEFKPYATNKLPHAKVVAVESDREFGLSVLERLDGVIRERAEKFRDAGTNDLPDYRKARPGEPMPRILFIVDEFQEFFTEEDRLAQQAGFAVRPLGAPGPGLRHARHIRLADPRRRVCLSPFDHRPDGRAHRPAKLRGRRPDDPRQGQQRGAIADSAGRGDLQLAERTQRGQRIIPGRLAAGRDAARRPGEVARDGRTAAPARRDRLRGQRPRRRPAEPRLHGVSEAAEAGERAADLARRGRGDQGADRGDGWLGNRARTC